MNEKKLIELFMDFNSEVLIKRTDTLKGIIECENQIEGWLKGELIGFLYSRFYKHGFEFETEVKTNNGKIDLLIEDNWVEVKHSLIGWRKGKQYNLSNYLRENTFKNDIEKLLEKVNEPKYILMLMTSNPGEQTICNEVMTYNEKSIRSTLTSLISVPLFASKSYFLALFKVEEKI